jgi:hypothetical protein
VARHNVFRPGAFLRRTQKQKYAVTNKTLHFQTRNLILVFSIFNFTFTLMLFMPLLSHTESGWSGSVGIAQSVQPRATYWSGGARFLTGRPDRPWSPPVSYPVGTGGKRPGREADHTR